MTATAAPKTWDPELWGSTMRPLRQHADASIGHRGPFTGILRGLCADCGHWHDCTYHEPAGRTCPTRFGRATALKAGVGKGDQ